MQGYFCINWKLQKYLNTPIYLKISIIDGIRQMDLIISGLHGVYMKVLFYSRIPIKMQIRIFPFILNLTIHIF